MDLFVRKINLLLIFTLTLFFSSQAQDVRLNRITSPVSGCMLTATEIVTVEIENVGLTDLSGTAFNVSYTINAAAPITENVTFASFAPNTTVTFSFTIAADLSVPGSFTFTATTILAGDINTTNDSFTGYTVVSSPVSVGGTIAGTATVCSSGNAGTLTLSGHTGTIIGWESSVDGGATFTNIANTTTTQNYSNLTQTTIYRATVQSGTCPAVNSATATVTVDQAPVGGTVAPNFVVCSGTNSGTMTLTGFSGTIARWEFSTDGGATYTGIANTTASNTFTNLTVNTLFRAVLSNGVCVDANSTDGSVTVDPVSVGGTIAGTATVCSSGNAGTLTLSGHTGTIIGWESSVDGGATFTNIANTTTTQNYSNLTQTTIYRATIQSGTCPPVNSATATVTVDQAPVGGTVAPNFVVCSGTNSGTMTLTGFSGTIARWEFSTDGGATYTGIANTTASNTFTNLTVNTLFRAVLSNGVCVDANSTDGSVTVDPVSVGGTIAGTATVCSSGNAGTLTLSGHTGTIIGWESSVDGGATFTNIANTTTTQNYSNLTQTTIYRATIQSGTCPAVNSATATVTVDQAPVGGTVGSNVEVCSTYNSGSLTLTGQTGTISNWESSIDNGTTWTPILNTTSTQTFTNLTTTTWYRAVMSNGVCTNVPSNFAVVTVNPKPVPNYTVPAVCIGNTSVFTNTSTIASGNIQFYLWDFGDFSSSVSVNPMHLYTAAGSYATSLITISDKGCADTAFVIAQVNALPDPTITASGPTSFCALGSVDLSGVAGLNYLWSTTETTQTITVNTTSMVVLTVTDPITLCQNSDSVQVTVFASPVANAGADTTISLGSSVQLNGSGGLTYYWSPGGSLNDSLISNPIATPVVSTSYQLIVTDANFCTDVDSMRVTILQDYTFTITNAMTPNGDGDNDVWNIIGIENYPDNEVHIYNRYGQEVFTAKPYNNTFDGKFDGNLLPDATYYYVLTFGNSPKIYKGAFTLIDGK